MLVHLAGALAVWALEGGRIQAAGAADRVHDVELADVGINDHETLLDQQRTFTATIAAARATVKECRIKKLSRAVSERA